MDESLRKAREHCSQVRSTNNKRLWRESWSMPNIEAHIDTVGGERSITAWDVKGHTRRPNRFRYIKRQVPVQGITFREKESTLGVWTCHGISGQNNSGLLANIDNVIVCPASWKFLQSIFKALKPSKTIFGIQQPKVQLCVWKISPNLAIEIRRQIPRYREHICSRFNQYRHYDDLSEDNTSELLRSVD